MSEAHPATPGKPVSGPPPKASRRERRRERKARGNGRDAGVQTPRLRDLLFKDLRPSELPGNFRKDLKQLYHFYLDEERRARLAEMGRLRRFFKLIGWTLKSLLAKLSPGRRLALFASIIMVFLGRFEMPIGDVTFRTNLRLWAYLMVFMVLMLELKDKVLAKDEIEVARQVQLALLPRTHPQPDGWSLWSFMRPANDVGADLVDYLDLPDGRLGIVLGDVAGKGLGAALLTAKMQATLRALVPTLPSLNELGGRMNDILHRDGIDNRFVTLFYCELVAGSERLRYLNAGHNPPFVVRAATIEDLEASAIPLGMMDGTTYREAETRLAPGDLLVVYSDGLTEARNLADEEYGTARLKTLLPGLRGLSAEESVKRIIDDVTRFLDGERPHDDLSLVVLARTESGAASRETQPGSAAGASGRTPGSGVTPPPVVPR